MQVAIIGCGYVGKALAQHLRTKSDYVITATTTTQERVAELETIAHRVAVLKGNDTQALTGVIQSQDAVILSVGAANADVYEETYLGTAKAIAAVLPKFPTVKQLIYTGSYALYGDRQGEWVDESTAIAPANQNGEIIAQTERVLLAMSNPALKVCIFRLGGIYGPGRELIKIFGRSAGMTRPGTGKEFSNWIHLEDIVGALTFALENPLQGIYNLVNSNPLPRGELIDRILEHHGLSKITWDASVKSTLPYNARVSNQKIQAAGYKFIHPEIAQY